MSNAFVNRLRGGDWTLNTLLAARLVAADEIDRLHAALRKYGRHTPECATASWRNHHPLRPCDCGFDALKL